MTRERITVIRKARYDDLSAKYELEQAEPCPMREGMSFISDGYVKPEGLCDSAWLTLQPFAMALFCGGSHIYGEWMKNPRSALISCNDGFRPVSFLLEAVDE